jgi:UDP:flavonoid glycosyltransferase YjiC (YdhE family)
VVVVPQMRKQEVAAQGCAELGLGVALDPTNLTAEKLHTAVEHVHDTASFRERFRAVQATIRAAGGYQRAADDISHFTQ